ncbi:MAG: amidohydrolase, partial [Gammaproteobacteria bacterium]|nr:amidohydrolase [Gammaproteobacteria bacterium]
DADKIFTNGKFYTVDTNQPWVEAVAIKDGKYLYVGNTEKALSYRGNNTQLIDLANKMAMPGINDAHLHPTKGGIRKLYSCNFSFSATPDEIAETIAKCVKQNPDALWIRGGQWTSDFFNKFKFDSPRKFLDKVSGDKAVFLQDDATHNAWVNSKALELNGITKDTPDPAGGTYVRDPETGEPNGILLEHASQSMFTALPEWSKEHYRKGTLEAIRIANQFGVTGMKNANARELTLATYKELDESGNFNIHMATSITTNYGKRVKLLNYDEIDRLRNTYKSENVHTNSVKIFMDGVPTASRTAAMLAPYTLAEPGDEPTTGMLHLEPELLTKDLIELDKRGYAVKIHVAGDRSVRVVLDAIAAARKANGNSGMRHELAHAGYIHQDDLNRFTELQAVVDLSPYIWHPSPIMDSVVSAVGSPRGEQYWPIRTLVELDAPMLAGSDWPAAVPTMDPWIGIEAMVSRADPLERFPGTFWSEQAISLAQALKIYTSNGAEALGLGDVTGSIEVGKSADFIVLNQNLFDKPITAISDTKVKMTLFKGDVVYQQK